MRSSKSVTCALVSRAGGSNDRGLIFRLVDKPPMLGDLMPHSPIGDFQDRQTFVADLSVVE
ncbi:hypothetical protein ACO34A_28450 (plasmid) [Rhizobium sp. ACO-34A]|nr:hypothetical protein ACO34A_28450 [Rhizobium sp. ACO-34A]